MPPTPKHPRAKPEYRIESWKGDGDLHKLDPVSQCGGLKESCVDVTVIRTTPCNIRVNFRRVVQHPQNWIQNLREVLIGAINAYRGAYSNSYLDMYSLFNAFRIYDPSSH